MSFKFLNLIQKPHPDAEVEFWPVGQPHRLRHLSFQRLPLIHKFLTDCFQWFSPLNPPILGDFKLRSPPSIGGTKGGECAC